MVASETAKVAEGIASMVIVNGIAALSQVVVEFLRYKLPV